jgi:DNA-binding response OmpR family regulator
VGGSRIRLDGENALGAHDPAARGRDADDGVAQGHPDGRPDRRPRRFGDVVVDLRRRRVTVAGRELPLRPNEFDLLARLAAEPEAALSRETPMSDVWDEHWFGSTKTLDVHVAALRRKMREVASGAARIPEIITLRGHGSRLELGVSGPGSLPV